jgi:hypothetical protein
VYPSAGVLSLPLSVVERQFHYCLRFIIENNRSFAGVESHALRVVPVTMSGFFARVRYARQFEAVVIKYRGSTHSEVKKIARHSGTRSPLAFVGSA